MRSWTLLVQLSFVFLPDLVAFLPRKRAPSLASRAGEGRGWILSFGFGFGTAHRFGLRLVDKKRSARFVGAQGCIRGRAHDRSRSDDCMRFRQQSVLLSVAAGGGRWFGNGGLRSFSVCADAGRASRGRAMV